MNEFSELHHTFLIGNFYKLLVDRFGARGRQAFIMGTQRYGEQRGNRMAQRAIRDGRALDFAAYKEYVEWENTETAKQLMGGNQCQEVSFTPNYETHWFTCPWCYQFKAMGLQECGILYCAHIDQAIARGFNPELKLEVPKNMNQYGKTYCQQIWYGANFEEGKLPQGKPENKESFAYHCAHLYDTYSSIAEAIFAEEGKNVAQEVLQRFAAEYGQEMAAVLKEYAGTDFNVIL